MDQVIIFDTTLRDGEQACGCSMTVAEKLRMARKLAELGVDVLEAGFPIASEGDFEAVRRIAQEVRGPILAGLARARTQDIERAAWALEAAHSARIHTFIATSPIHRIHKLRMEKQQVLEEAAAAVRQARRYMDDVEFSAEDATRTEPDFLCEVARAVVEAGAKTVNIPDTVGYATPEGFAAMVSQVVSAVGDRAVVSVHCHDDLGLATANSLAGVRAGARQVECTINGIGERAGNAALEEVVMALRTRRDFYGLDTTVRTQGLFPASQALIECISFGPQPNKAIVGRNAFAHEAGIHQDGFLKERTTYEIMDPKDVGVPESKLILGKHSGRHALKIRMAQLGQSLEAAALERAYTAFIALADRQKGVSDAEILDIAKDAALATA
ncbi:MAG TPA: 2-isopropylmalate synthase [Holophagaceae bacterium]|jgi:2-isopropylmalate synthase|nr:2-isopropylmalate synthase [Holophagaceae bacterium]